MPNKVTLTPYFEGRYRRFAKKFASLESEVDILINNIIETPTVGESLGAGLYKIRLTVKSKGKGKRGGFRVITYLLAETQGNADIFLLTVYDKSEESRINKSTLLALAKAISGE